jgi:hypothetical protein
MILKLTRRARAKSSLELFSKVSSSRRIERGPSQEACCWLDD